jgi:hypothetical protein
MSLTQVQPQPIARPLEREGRRFFRELGGELSALGEGVRGVANASARESFAWLALTRLLAAYLAQRHTLLGQGERPLEQRLERHLLAAHASEGSFYRRELLPLFERRAGEAGLLATILPAPWGIELAEPDADLADAAVGRVLRFFAGWRWRLDELEPAAAWAVTPAALGGLLELHLDRKRRGAYYTAGDVAGYMARTTIIPALLDALARAAPQMLGPAGWGWNLLRERPERYIFAELGHGVEHELPAKVASGIVQSERRARWNELAGARHGLSGETWRELLARHGRFVALRQRLAQGELRDANALVSWNIDLQRFAADLLERCSDAELPACWQALSSLRVLDPTCGAGAFLIAALEVLEPLHTICWARRGALSHATASAWAGFEAGHPAQLRAALVAQTLHGVDLMEEAVAVCRMRLALGVAALAPQLIDASYTKVLERQIRHGDVLLGAAEGFDAVIGNPPYLGQARGKLGTAAPSYRTAGCGNLYALVVERALQLTRPGGRCAMIVPIASVSTETMRPLQELYRQHRSWHSHYAVRPGKLFDDVDMNLTISLFKVGDPSDASATTGYQRWSARSEGERARLFRTLAYLERPHPPAPLPPFPKLASAGEAALLETMQQQRRTLGSYATACGTTIYYHSGGRYWRKALPEKLSSHYKPLTLPERLAPIGLALLNSQLFYWYWIINSNCQDVVAREVLGLPVFALEAADPRPFEELTQQLLDSYRQRRRLHRRRGALISTQETELDARAAKPTIDAIDRLLARHYGLSAEQLDFVLNFDARFRLGGVDSYTAPEPP